MKNLKKDLKNIPKVYIKKKIAKQTNKKPSKYVQFSSVVAETSTQETKHHTRRVGEFRFIMPEGPEELTLQALSPEQRDYRVFKDRL